MEQRTRSTGCAEPTREWCFSLRYFDWSSGDHSGIMESFFILRTANKIRNFRLFSVDLRESGFNGQGVLFARNNESGWYFSQSICRFEENI